MPRRSKAAGTEVAPAPRVVPVINERGLYRPADVIAIFGLGASSIRAEVRAGRLKPRKRCGKYFFLGSDLIEWLGETR